MPGDVESLVLTTERLILRPHQLDDVPFMVELNSDPEVVRYTGDAPFTSPSEAEEIVRSLVKQHTEQRMGRLVVIERASGERIGWCGLKQLPGYVDLGYRFLRRAWGQGFATEAGAASIRYGFEVLGLERIIARALPGNGASHRVLRKLGFEQIGTFVEGELEGLEFELQRGRWG